MRRLLALALLPLAALSAAQTNDPLAAPGESPEPLTNLRLRFGAFFPTYRRSGVSTQPGFAFGLGYTFLRRERYALEAEYFGSVTKTDTTVGGTTFGDDVNLSVVSVIARLRPDKKSYFGGGLGLGTGNARNVRDGLTGVATILAGYNVTEHVFFELRYQKGFETYLDGIGLTAGYRF